MANKKTGGKTGDRRGGKRSTSFKPGNKTKSQWKPGIRSPHPEGAPRLGDTWKALIKSIGDESITGNEEEYKDLKLAGISKREASVRKGYKMIAAGHYPIMKEFIEREEGKVPQPVEHDVGEELAALIDKHGIGKENPIIQRMIRKFGDAKPE